MLEPWLELDAFAQRLTWCSAVVGMDLARFGTQGSAEEIRDTAVAQPLLVATALAGWAALDPSTAPDVAVGHSVGELVATALAGVISAEAALVLARERGHQMAAATKAAPTGMTAVLGGVQDDVLDAISTHGLTAANVNGAGQIVAAGTADQLERFAADPPAGARLRPLPVAGAFHTEHMAPATAHLATLVSGIDAAAPVCHLLSNAAGEPVSGGRQMLDQLVAQIARPVRWDLCMQTLGRLGVTAVLELPPAGTLAGLIRRTLPDVEVVAVKGPGDLDAARTLIAHHCAEAVAA